MISVIRIEIAEGAVVAFRLHYINGLIISRGKTKGGRVLRWPTFNLASELFQPPSLWASLLQQHRQPIPQNQLRQSSFVSFPCCFIPTVVVSSEAKQSDALPRDRNPFQRWHWLHGRDHTKFRYAIQNATIKGFWDAPMTTESQDLVLFEVI